MWQFKPIKVYLRKDHLIYEGYLFDVFQGYYTKERTYTYEHIRHGKNKGEVIKRVNGYQYELCKRDIVLYPTWEQWLIAVQQNK